MLSLKPARQGTAKIQRGSALEEGLPRTSKNVFGDKYVYKTTWNIRGSPFLKVSTTAFYNARERRKGIYKEIFSFFLFLSAVDYIVLFASNFNKDYELSVFCKNTISPNTNPSPPPKKMMLCSGA